MSEPILIARHKDRREALGFSPHGAGRNMSRTRYMPEVIGMRGVEDVMKSETAGLDVRFWCGKPDLSELPGAYKSAHTGRGAESAKQKLAEIVDHVDPYGSIIARNWEQNAPWRKKKARWNKSKPVREFDAALEPVRQPTGERPRAVFALSKRDRAAGDLGACS